VAPVIRAACLAAPLSSPEAAGLLAQKRLKSGSKPLAGGRVRAYRLLHRVDAITDEKNAGRPTMNLAAAPVFTAPVAVDPSRLVDPIRLVDKVSELFPYALAATLCAVAVTIGVLDQDTGLMLADLSGYLG
jgi:hypothetical protein